MWGRRACRIERDRTHVAPVQLDRDAPSLGTPCDPVQDVTSAASDIEDPNQATLSSVQAKDVGPDPIGDQRDAVDPGERTERVDMAGPLETRIIHELRSSAPNGEINSARHSPAECGSLGIRYRAVRGTCRIESCSRYVSYREGS